MRSGRVSGQDGLLQRSPRLHLQPLYQQVVCTSLARSEKQEPDAGYLHLGDIDCSIVYLVLICCALTVGVDTKLLPTPDRYLSSPLFAAHVVFQGCAEKCPDIFGADTNLHELFYMEKR